MKNWATYCRHGVRFCAECAAQFGLWSLWLVLVLLLVFQLYIALARELPVPGFILRTLESRLESTGVNAVFGRTSFDPSGRIHIADAELRLGADGWPAVSARQLYIELNPWALLGGRVEPGRLRISGLNFWVPAMLSASGRPESIVQDVELTADLDEAQIVIRECNARLAGMPVTLRGTLDTTPWRRQTAAQTPLPELFARHYPALSRRLDGLAAQLSDLEEPRLEVRLRPSPARAAVARIELLARGWQQERGHLPMTVGPLQLSTRVPVWGATPFYVRVSGRTDSLALPRQITTGPVRAEARARIDPAGGQVGFRQAEFSVEQVRLPELPVAAVSGRVLANTEQQWRVETIARVLDEGVALEALVDPLARSGTLHAVGRLDPDLLAPLGRRLGQDLRPWIRLGAAPEFDLHSRFEAGAKYAGTTGWVSARHLTGRNVTFDRIGGHVAFDGRRFSATEAEAWIGRNHARGTFVQDFASREFRFLLRGRLDPPVIGGWFRDWWPRFWQNFDFSAAPPDADVDVQGRWKYGWETTVFVYADSRAPVIRGVPLDHARTLINLRPHFYDGLEVFATHGAESARGWFVRRFSDHGFKPRRLDFDFTSSLPLEAAGLVGPALTDIVAPFTFENPPTVRARGFITAETAVNGEPVRRIQVEGNSSGAFTFHRFPLRNLSFGAVMNGNDLLLEPVDAGFALGQTNGRIRLDLSRETPRLGFDLDLQQANLRQATAILNEFSALRRGDPPPDPSTYVRHSAEVTMDIGLSAEGDFHDPMSFSGSGNAELSGPGLGEVRLLGLLSELLNFTALKFNNLRANYTLERDQLDFSEVSITGNNASVSASGRYALDRGTLDFNARIYPFQESTFILKNVVGAVLSPLSTVLAVKLTGRLDNPKWAFVIGPTNFLRNLTQPTPAKPDPTVDRKTDAPAPTDSPP